MAPARAGPKIPATGVSRVATAYRASDRLMPCDAADSEWRSTLAAMLSPSMQLFDQLRDIACHSQISDRCEAAFHLARRNRRVRHQRAVFRLDVRPIDAQPGRAFRYQHGVGYSLATRRLDAHRGTLAIFSGILDRRRVNPDLIDQW